MYTRIIQMDPRGSIPSWVLTLQKKRGVESVIKLQKIFEGLQEPVEDQLEKQGKFHQTTHQQQNQPDKGIAQMQPKIVERETEFHAEENQQTKEKQKDQNDANARSNSTTRFETQVSVSPSQEINDNKEAKLDEDDEEFYETTDVQDEPTAITTNENEKR